MLRNLRKPSRCWVYFLNGEKHQHFLSTSSSIVTDGGGGGGDSGGGGTVSSGACFKCGKEGHWARDCTQMMSSVLNLGPSMEAASTAVNVVEKMCPCGSGKCLVLTAKTERNLGRKFYRCPLRQENGGCGFFEWCDSSSGNYNSVDVFPVQGEKACKNGVSQPYFQHPTNQGLLAFPESWNDDYKRTNSPNLNYGAVQKFDAAVDNKSSGTRTSSSCFKCGEEGHWAKDCPSSDGVKANSVSGACFKCGQPGHWARDCSEAQSTTSLSW